MLALVATASAEPAERETKLALYLEPSLLLSLGSYSPVPYFLPRPANHGDAFARVSFGMLARFCDGAGVHLRAGVTGYGTTIGWIGATDTNYGFGGELSANYPVAPTVRLGGRVGFETARASTGLITLGARARVGPSIWFGADVYHRRPSGGTPCSELIVPDCATTTTGVMVGLGGTGRGGGTVAKIGLVVVGVILGIQVVGNATAGDGHE